MAESNHDLPQQENPQASNQLPKRPVMHTSMLLTETLPPILPHVPGVGEWGRFGGAACLVGKLVGGAAGFTQYSGEREDGGRKRRDRLLCQVKSAKCILGQMFLDQAATPAMAFQCAIALRRCRWLARAESFE